MKSLGNWSQANSKKVVLKQKGEHTGGRQDKKQSVYPGRPVHKTHTQQVQSLYQQYLFSSFNHWSIK